MALDLKISPVNLIDWGGFESWSAGVSSAPDGWTLTGAGASIAREATTKKIGDYAAKLTRGGTNCYISLTLSDYEDYKGKTVKLGVWVNTSIANAVLLTIDDGVGTTDSSNHTGGGGWEWLTVTRNIDASATKIEIMLKINTTDGDAFFDDVLLVEGEDLYFDLTTATYAVGDCNVDNPNRMSNYTIPRKDGDFIDDDKLEPIRIALKGDLIGTDAPTVRTNLDALIEKFTQGEKELYLFDDRKIKVRKRSFKYFYERPIVMAKFNIDFIAGVPFWVSVSKYRNKQVISASPTTYSITPGGNAYSKPKITIDADQGVDVTSVVLENLTSGEKLSYSATISSGNSLVIDCDKFTVENNSVDDIGNFSGDFLKLLGRENKIKYTGANCTIKVEYSDRWY